MVRKMSNDYQGPGYEQITNINKVNMEPIESEFISTPR